MTEPVTGCPEPRGESSFVDKGKKIGASSLGIRMTLVLEYPLRVYKISMPYKAGL